MALLLLLQTVLAGCNGCGPVVEEAGGQCEQQGDCAEGLWCLGRVCRPAPGVHLPQDGGEDATSDDGGTDAGSDGGVPDTGFDAGFDGGFDAGFDSGFDAGIDGGLDAAVDAGEDGASTDAQDAGQVDGGPSEDARVDGGSDGGDGGPAPCIGGTIEVEANPSQLTSDGVSAAVISAIPKRCDGTGMPDPTHVLFTTTDGLFVGTSDTILIIPTAAGEAKAVLLVPLDVHPVLVQASFRAADGTVVLNSVKIGVTSGKNLCRNLSCLPGSYCSVEGGTASCITGCRNYRDCPPKNGCVNGGCVPTACTGDSDCGQYGFRACSIFNYLHHCVECQQDSHCPDSMSCDLADAVCKRIPKCDPPCDAYTQYCVNTASMGTCKAKPSALCNACTSPTDCGDEGLVCSTMLMRCVVYPPSCASDNDCYGTHCSTGGSCWCQ